MLHRVWLVSEPVVSNGPIADKEIGVTQIAQAKQINFLGIFVFSSNLNFACSSKRDIWRHYAYVHICRVLSPVAVCRSRSVLSCEDILILWQTDTQSAAAVKLSAAGEIYWAGRTHRIVCRVTRYKRVTVTLLSRTHNSDGAQHHVTVLALTPLQSVNPRYTRPIKFTKTGLYTGCFRVISKSKTGK